MGMGPFTENDDEDACGKAGPFSLRKATVLTGRAGPHGRVPLQRRTTKMLTGRLGPYGKPFTGRDGMGPFTEKDDEEAYGKAGPLRKRLTGRLGPYGKPGDGPCGKGRVPYRDRFLHKKG